MHTIQAQERLPTYFAQEQLAQEAGVFGVSTKTLVILGIAGVALIVLSKRL